eukprot:TRINITY_DN4042_c0_g2_i7.p2 TRINITY_DN4042_c0_g2~~TRINITY_DN4042_c0_g2_i7.p2  ORF type:complete len:130 (-),score=30.64 TRINITY_DN4042_c0_g2_i7:128-517(-)
MLDDWVQAKRAKDFETADSICAELREQGIEPAAARPDPRRGGGGGTSRWAGGGGGGRQGPGPQKYDQETETMLDDWVQAKRAKDFETADSICAELREQGIEPAEARPDPRRAKGNGKGSASANGRWAPY